MTLSSITGTVVATADRWYHIRAICSDGNNDGLILFFVNGEFIGSDIVTNAWDYGGTGTLYLGARYDGTNGIDCFMDQITISKSITTPQNWTAFGKPLWRPLIQVG